MKKKIVAAALACVLCVGLGIGGTLAWLTAQSGEVKNTFTTSNIDITLTETTGAEYKMIPGHTIAKDPKAAVVAGSEDCYLFVKIDKSENYDDYLEDYTVAAGWTALPDVADVYYRVVMAVDDVKEFAVLDNNEVTVREDVTKADMEALNATNYPTLTFTAYAVQYYETNGDAFTPAEAWANRPTA